MKIKIAEIMGKAAGGGTESFVYNYVSNLDPNQFAVDFIIFENSPYLSRDFTKIGRVIKIPSYKNLILYTKNLLKLYHQQKYDVVHCHINEMSAIALTLAKITNIPIRISHSHTIGYKSVFYKDFIKKIFREVININATKYLCCSSEAGSYLFGSKNLDNNKVQIINNAIDTIKFQYNPKKRQQVRHQNNIPENTIVLGHVGRFSYEKNHRYLIEILKNALKYNEHVILVLVGIGETKEEIKKLVSEKNLQNKVLFLDQTDQIEDIYQMFDIFILPSFHEGLPLVGIEAQCSGLPCLFSNAIPDAVKITDNSYFLDIHDTPELWAVFALDILKNYHRVDCHNQVIEAGYDIKDNVKKLELIYKEQL